MGKQVGPTPITAKLKRTTKGGIVQPQLKTLQSPAQKALVGKQHNLPDHLKAKIEAAPESPAKLVPLVAAGLAVAGRYALKKGAQHLAKKAAQRYIAKKGISKIAGKGGREVFKGMSGKFVKNPGTGKIAKTIKGVERLTLSPFGNSKLGTVANAALAASTGLGMVSPKKASPKAPEKTNKKSVGQSKTDIAQKALKPKKSSKPNKSSKPKYNTSIKNYGLNTQARRDEYARRGWKQDATTTIKDASKDTSASKTKKASTTPQSRKQTTSETTKKVKTTKKAETSIKASKLRAKGEKALAEGKTAKAQRLRKRYDRKTARDQRKAARKEKRSLVQDEISKLTSPNKNYKKGYYNKK